MFAVGVVWNDSAYFFGEEKCLFRFYLCMQMLLDFLISFFSYFDTFFYKINTNCLLERKSHNVTVVTLTHLNVG